MTDTTTPAVERIAKDIAATPFVYGHEGELLGEGPGIADTLRALAAERDNLARTCESSRKHIQTLLAEIIALEALRADEIRDAVREARERK